MSLIRFTVIEPNKIELLKELYLASVELPDNNPNSMKKIISNYVLMAENDKNIYDCTIYEIAKADVEQEKYNEFLARLGPYITDRMIPDEDAYDLVRYKISGIIDFAFKTLSEGVLDIEVPDPDIYKFIIPEILYKHICESYSVMQCYIKDDRIYLTIKKKD